MYSREYQGKELHFEASGGLIHSALVMQDQETDSYWSIMSGTALKGEFEGTELIKLPLGTKIQWKEWVKKYPDTLVLSVNGKEDAPESYRQYFQDPNGFRGTKAQDKRLSTKEPIFAFHDKNSAYAVRHTSLLHGKVFTIKENTQILLYRSSNNMFSSTIAYQKGVFKKHNDSWIETQSGCQFSIEQEIFLGDNCPSRLNGFDTFWYTWSLMNPETFLLE